MSEFGLGKGSFTCLFRFRFRFCFVSAVVSIFYAGQFELGLG